MLSIYRTAASFSLLLILATNALASPLHEQIWVRDSDGPVISLGEPGAFDDTHLFAPCVMEEKGTFTLYYSGSTNDVANRVFQMGRATSTDGIHFTKDPEPIFAFGDGKHSILTPTLLRNPNGSVHRENGELRLWFAATDFVSGTGAHTLHEATSDDGIAWSAPSSAQFDGIYAPTIIKEGNLYHMWYSDVSADPWIVRHAQSPDGRTWAKTETPCIVIDQTWEKNRLFYPAVIKHGDTWVMWYGAYWNDRENTTAIGTATSTDGVNWTKAANNPVLTPDETRPWESHYTTSQSVMKLKDGSWRIWYASRKAPPFVNKYFAIGTARWEGPSPEQVAWPKRAESLRKQMAAALTLPTERVPLDAKTHRSTQGTGYTIESVTYASEPGSRVTALLYLPDTPRPAPAIVMACGHGGSKSALYAQYAGQLYATYGFATLVVDTIGEEERHVDRKLGARGHDLYHLPKEARAAFMTEQMQRSVLGKLVWDLTRGVDYLEARSEVDRNRIGVVGYSLGGASAGSLAILDPRIKSAVISGWGFIPSLAEYGKACTLVPYQDFSAIMDFGEMTALLAPHAATLFLSGTSDTIIDPDHGGAALQQGIEAGIASAKARLKKAGITPSLESAFVPDACHRPYILTPKAVQWMSDHLGADVSAKSFATTNYGAWVDAQGQKIEGLYATEARERGTTVVDVNAIYRTPSALACFPNEGAPTELYTFQGWMARCLEAAK